MTIPPKQKAVIYCRVSSNKQVAQGHGLSSQETRCREYARSKGYEVIQVFNDEAMSGKILDRPAIQLMLSYLRKSKKDQLVVIIDDISRLARDIETHIQLRAAIADVNGKLESPSIEFGEDSDSRLVEHLLASVAAHSREKNAEQVKNRMRARVLNGYCVTSPVIGYCYEKVAGHGKLLVRDEPLASIIQEALLGFASGKLETQSEVKRFLESHEAYPKANDGSVHWQRVAEMFERVVYAGRLSMPNWGIHNHPAKHEALVSFETWMKIQDRLKQQAKAPIRKDVSEDFPLRGFVTCGCCGKPLTSCWSKGRSAKYPYYSCYTKDCDMYRKSIRKEKVEADFEALLFKLKPSEDLFLLAQAMFEELWNDRVNNQEGERVTIESELHKLNRQSEQLMDRIVETENLTLIHSYEKRMQKLEDQKAVLHEKMAKCGSALPDYNESFRTAFSFLGNPYELWASERLEDKRAALKLVFTERLPYDKKEGFRTAPIAQPFRVIGDLQSGKDVMVDLNGDKANQLFDLLADWNRCLKGTILDVPPSKDKQTKKRSNTSKTDSEPEI